MSFLNGEKTLRGVLEIVNWRLWVASSSSLRHSRRLYLRCVWMQFNRSLTRSMTIRSHQSSSVTALRHLRRTGTSRVVLGNSRLHELTEKQLMHSNSGIESLCNQASTGRSLNSSKIVERFESSVTFWTRFARQAKPKPSSSTSLAY